MELLTIEVQIPADDPQTGGVDVDPHLRVTFEATLRAEIRRLSHVYHLHMSDVTFRWPRTSEQRVETRRAVVDGVAAAYAREAP